MAVFGEVFCRNRGHPDADGYKEALQSALVGKGLSEQEQLLRGEIGAILGRFTDDLQWLIHHDRKVWKTVFEEGLPLSSWTLYLNSLAKRDWASIEPKILEMRRDMEQGRVQGLPGTMFLYGKMSLVELDPFCQAVFDVRREMAARS